MDQFSDQLMYNTLLYLRQFYVNDTRKYVTINDIYTFLYNGYLSLNIVLNQNQFMSALDYLKSIGFVELDPPFYYRLTAQGNRFVENPPQNYAALSLAAQENSNHIALESNRIAQGSNQIAEKSNEIAERANRIAFWSFVVAVVSIIISIIALAK
jgi:hypothetical protein